MNHKIKQDPHLETEHYRELLDLSTEHLKPSVKARLDECRHQALEETETKPLFKRLFWQPATAFIIPAFILAVIVLIPNNELPVTNESDIYADLQLLEEEDQLEFLAELNVSEWLDNENDG